MKIRIYRTDSIYEGYIDVNAFEANVSRVLNSKDEITFRTELDHYEDFPLGSSLIIQIGKNRRYFLNDLPIHEKVSEGIFDEESQSYFGGLHKYSFTFKAPIFNLEKVFFLNADSEASFNLDGKASDFVALIVSNMSRYTGTIYSTWVAGVSDVTTYKNIQFQGQNCWQALNMVCDEFGLEFQYGLSGSNQTLSLVSKVGNATGISLSYGAGIRNLKRTNVDVDKLVTRLYYRGSERNLPPDYPYPRLRGSALYIEDQAKIDLYGKREGYIEFDEIKPHFTGHVLYYGMNTENQHCVQDNTFPFDLWEKDVDGNHIHLVPGTCPKINFRTGNCAGYTFDIFDYNAETHTFKIIAYKDEQGKEWPNATVFPSSENGGDEFVIIDMIMPESYVTQASSDLDAEAASEYLKVSTPRVAYTAESDPNYFAANTISLDLGDVVSIPDPDLSINETCRAIELSFPLFDRAKVTAKLSDVRFAIPKRKELMLLKSAEVVINANKSKSPERIMRNAKTTNELKNAIFAPRPIDSTGDVTTEEFFIPEKNAIESIDPYMLSLDAGELQFSLKDITIEPNFAGFTNKLRCNPGTVYMHSVFGKTRSDIKKLKAQMLDYVPQRETAYAGETLTLADDAKSYFIYLKLKIKPIDSDAPATIIVDENHLSAKSAPDYILYKLGYVSAAVNGVRNVKSLWGDSGHSQVSLAEGSNAALSLNGQVLTLDLSAFAKATDLHPAVTINPDSASMASVNEEQVLTINPSPVQGGVTWFLHSEDSDISGYESIQIVPVDDAEVVKQVAVNAAGGETTIEEFATVAIGGDLPAGSWQFTTYMAASAIDAATTAKAKVYKRDSTGVETLLFEKSFALDSIAVKCYVAIVVQPLKITLAETDRVVVKYTATTESVTDVSVSLYYEGSANYSTINTPLSTLNEQYWKKVLGAENYYLPKAQKVFFEPDGDEDQYIHFATAATDADPTTQPHIQLEKDVLTGLYAMYLFGAGYGKPSFGFGDLIHLNGGGMQINASSEVSPLRLSSASFAGIFEDFIDDDKDAVVKRFYNYQSSVAKNAFAALEAGGFGLFADPKHWTGTAWEDILLSVFRNTAVQAATVGYVPHIVENAGVKSIVWAADASGGGVPGTETLTYASALTLNWNGNTTKSLTLTGACALTLGTAANYVLRVEITGNYSVTLPSTGIIKVSGSYSGTKTNVIDFIPTASGVTISIDN